MKEIKIKNTIKKIKELKIHNKSYFEDSSPKISDKQYDDIKRILNLEKNYNFLKSNTTSKSLGFTPQEFIKLDIG